MKLVNVILISIILSLSNVALAHDCEEVIEAADKVIEELDLTVTKQARYIGFLEKRQAELEVNLEEQMEVNHKWYRNPAVTVALGIALGVLTGSYLNGR